MTSAREPFAPSPPLPLRRGGFFSPLAKGHVENSRLFAQNKGAIGRKPPIYLEKPAENRIFAYPLRSVSQR